MDEPVPNDLLRARMTSSGSAVGLLEALALCAAFRPGLDSRPPSHVAIDVGYFVVCGATFGAALGRHVAGRSRRRAYLVGILGLTAFVPLASSLHLVLDAVSSGRLRDAIEGPFGVAMMWIGSLPFVAPFLIVFGAFTVAILRAIEARIRLRLPPSSSLPGPRRRVS